jgi:hypothetical protein
MAQVEEKMRSKVMKAAWIILRNNPKLILKNNFDHKRSLWSNCLRTAWKCYKASKKTTKFDMIDYKKDISDKTRAWIAEIDINSKGKINRFFVNPSVIDNHKYFQLDDGVYEISDPVDIDTVDRYFARIINHKVTRCTYQKLRAQ